MIEIIKTNFPGLDESVQMKIKEFAENIAKQTEQTAFSNATKKAYENIENTLIELGIEKTENIKTSDLIKNSITSYKSEIDKLKSKIDKAVTGSDKEKDLQNQLVAMEKAIKDKETFFTKELSEKENNYKKELTKHALLSSFPNVSNSGLPDKTIEVLKNQAVSEILNKASYENGQIVFRDENKNLLFNQANNMKPFTPEEMFKSLDYLQILFTNQKNNIPKVGDDPNGNSLEFSIENITKYRKELINSGITNYSKQEEMIKKKFEKK